VALHVARRSGALLDGGPTAVEPAEASHA
jgi:hypothetical protein